MLAACRFGFSVVIKWKLVNFQNREIEFGVKAENYRNDTKNEMTRKHQ